MEWARRIKASVFRLPNTVGNGKRRPIRPYTMDMKLKRLKRRRVSTTFWLEGAFG